MSEFNRSAKKKTHMNTIIAALFGRKEAREVIRREVTARHAEELKRSGLWRRLVVWLRIEREVNSELKRKFPPHALYAAR